MQYFILQTSIIMSVYNHIKPETIPDTGEASPENIPSFASYINLIKFSKIKHSLSN